MISQHTLLAYIVILLVSFSESLAIVGLVVPGTLIMFGIGVVVSTGSLNLKVVLALAVVGAITGDGISYWLGHHYKNHLRQIWPFSRYPALLKKGLIFFESHGGKSVLFGRFVGPVRAIIPVVAGMMEMEPLYFSVINVLSAIGWSLFFILPGFFVGTSLAVAGAVSARLAILGFILFAAVWIFLWLGRRVASEVSEIGSVWFAAFMEWLASDRTVPWILRPVKHFFSYLFLRRQGEELFTGFLIMVFFLTCWGFLGVLQDVISRDPLVLADHAVYNFFLSLRTPWANNLFIVITEFGDLFVNICLFCAVLIVLIAKRCHRTAIFWILTVLGGFTGVQLLKNLIRSTRPVAIYHGASAFGFPSCHTTMSIVLYGFLIIILTRDIKGNMRWKFFATVLLVSFAISISRLYLGANWLSDVLGGFFIGTSWTILFGITWLKKSIDKLPVTLLGIVIILVVMIAGGWHIALNHEKDLVLYAPHRNIKTMELAAWYDSGWKRIPAWRFDIAGERKQPLTLQFAGSPRELARYMLTIGWHRPSSMNMKNFLGIFSPHVPIEEFPVLPHLHSGRVDCLRLIYSAGNSRWVLRLWPSDFRIAKNKTPLYVGTIEVQRFRHLTGLITAAMDTGDYDRPIVTVKNMLKNRFVIKTVMRSGNDLRMEDYHGNLHWHGMVLLIWQSAIISGTLTK